MNGIYFPGPGIGFGNVPSGINVFGFEIKFYGVIIALGFMLALKSAMREAKLSGQNEENYVDFLLVLVIPAILGARLYYILFRLDDFIVPGQSLKDTLLGMLNLRNGGLAIYGGLIAGTIVVCLFSKKRGIPIPLFGDTITMGILIGQILGRWGNFFNREVFGDYTSGFLRMGIPVGYYSDTFMSEYLKANGIVNDAMLSHQEMINGVSCITVHPTFLYESLWNVALLIFMLIYRKRKKFDGELSMMYLVGYGVGRFLIEGIRTDSLMIGPLKVSQVVAVSCILVGGAVLCYNYIRIKKGIEPKLHPISMDNLKKDSNVERSGEESGEKAEKANEH